jgi:hypothetical protein
MSRIRSMIREVVACEPDGCGAQPGEHCRAYVPKRGKTTGKPTGDVHAARWRAWRAWLKTRTTANAASFPVPCAPTGLVQLMPVQRGEMPRVLPDADEQVAASVRYMRGLMTGPLCGAWLTRIPVSDPGSSASTAAGAGDADTCSSPVS